MGYNCPKCNEAIDAVSKQAFDERVKSNAEALKAVKDAATEAEKRAKVAEEKAGQYDVVAGKLAAIEKAGVRNAAFDKAGIAQDEKVRARFAAIFEAEQAGKAEGEAVDFGAWMEAEETRTDPFLAPHYKQPAAQGAGQTQQPAAKPKVTTRTETGAGDPPAGGAVVPKTPAELQAHLNSPGFKALPKDKRQAELSRLQAAVGVSTS
jgi:hypothetical protein